MEYIASCSFGKDSLATILLALQHNEPLDMIVFCEVMFDAEKKISGENPEHIKWIKSCAIPRIEKLTGIKVEILQGVDYLSMFHRVKMRGTRIGEIYGFPMGKPFGCFMNGAGKRDVMDKLYKAHKGATFYEGLAIDEPNRLERMKANRPGHVSLLEKYGYTEKMAYSLCEDNGLLSPIYKNHRRSGCWFCPNAKVAEFMTLKAEHPDLFQALRDLAKVPGAKRFKMGMTFEEMEERIEMMEKEMTLF